MDDPDNGSFANYGFLDDSYQDARIGYLKMIWIQQTENKVIGDDSSGVGVDFALELLITLMHVQMSNCIHLMVLIKKRED